MIRADKPLNADSKIKSAAHSRGQAKSHLQGTWWVLSFTWYSHICFFAWEAQDFTHRGVASSTSLWPQVVSQKWCGQVSNLIRWPPHGQLRCHNWALVQPSVTFFCERQVCSDRQPHGWLWVTCFDIDCTGGTICPRRVYAKKCSGVEWCWNLYYFPQKRAMNSSLLYCLVMIVMVITKRTTIMHINLTRYLLLCNMVHHSWSLSLCCLSCSFWTDPQAVLVALVDALSQLCISN